MKSCLIGTFSLQMIKVKMLSFHIKTHGLWLIPSFIYNLEKLLRFCLKRQCCTSVSVIILYWKWIAQVKYLHYITTYIWASNIYLKNLCLCWNPGSKNHVLFRYNFYFILFLRIESPIRRVNAHALFACHLISVQFLYVVMK